MLTCWQGEKQRSLTGRKCNHLLQIYNHFALICLEANGTHGL